MADMIKKFFAKKKLEAKFKMAGPGRRLTDGPVRSDSVPKAQAVRSEDDVCTESRVAAAAALARLQQKRENPAFNTSLAAIQAQVKRELESEQSASSAGAPSTARDSSQEQQVAKHLAVGGVYYKCPLISDEVLPRDEWKMKIKEFLYAQLEEEPALTAVLIIHSCNTGREKIETCVNTLCKYLENIVTHPEEEKYRKVRMSNRVFTERVQGVEGAREVLRAAGFRERMLPGADGGEEQFLVFSEDQPVESLVPIIEALRTAEPLQMELDRSVRVLLPSQAVVSRELPAAFYNLTPEELKKEQLLRSEAIERSQMLRTKAMREKDEQREMKKYRFALIRVRFPDGILLQGTFSVYEKYSDIHEFVEEHLENGGLPFVLHGPTGIKMDAEQDGGKTLLDLRLVPTSVLTFSWDPTVIDEINRSPNRDVYLKPEVMLLVQEMN